MKQRATVPNFTPGVKKKPPVIEDGGEAFLQRIGLLLGSQSEGRVIADERDTNDGERRIIAVIVRELL